MIKFNFESKNVTKLLAQMRTVCTVRNNRDDNVETELFVIITNVTRKMSTICLASTEEKLHFNTNLTTVVFCAFQ